MKRKIFFRFFSVTLVATLLMFACGIIAVRENADAQMRDRLKEETELICSFVESSADFGRLEKYERDEAFRVTVIDLDGAVLYESDTRAPLENHGAREEIKKALAGEPTAVERYSETFACAMTYYAMRTELADGAEVIVRLAVRSSRINEYFGVALPILVVVLACSLVASVIVSGALSERIAKRVGEIGASLKSLNAGAYVPIRTDTSEPEFYSVLKEINDVNESTHAYMRKLADEHAKLDSVLENVAQGIVALDGGGKIVFANKSAMRLFGAKSDAAGKELMFLVDDAKLCEAIMGRRREEHVGEYSYKGAVLSVAIKQPEEGGAVAAIVIITDITGERELQKQKSDFFANASHELKTPVTVMAGLSELLLLKEGTDEGMRRQIERIHSESTRLAALVGDMLELSRLEGGALTERARIDVDLAQVARDVAAELADEMERKRIAFRVEGAATVRADNARMYELVQNLVSNAVNYNKENGEIRVELAEGAAGATLRVIDTGIGIEKENIPHLCERFFRVDRSRSKKTGGTGLGLAIVKHICALYDAELAIESEPGRGTEVRVAFKGAR